jgi:hypothetical protein
MARRKTDQTVDRGVDRDGVDEGGADEGWSGQGDVERHVVAVDNGAVDVDHGAAGTIDVVEAESEHEGPGETPVVPTPLLPDLLLDASDIDITNALAQLPLSDVPAGDTHVPHAYTQADIHAATGTSTRRYTHTHTHIHTYTHMHTHTHT